MRVPELNKSFPLVSVPVDEPVTVGELKYRPNVKSKSSFAV